MSRGPIPTVGIEPFRVNIPESTVVDLRARIEGARWPEKETVDDWSQGVPLQYLRKLCQYWLHEYDMFSIQRRLNEVPQFRTDVGIGIHFLQVQSPEESAMPLVMTHGWPGSVIEFLNVIKPLTNPRACGADPKDAFHVVCPSLPGFGFSDKPDTPGWDVHRIAQGWAELMSRLGYQRFLAQGGDWGAFVSSELGIAHSRKCIGVHLNMTRMDLALSVFDDPTESETKALADRELFEREGRGYGRIQSTRPQTLGYALVDSPIGQAAWILEKFREWTDCDGDPERVLTRDELLDNVMIYWLTNSGASSARLYWRLERRSAGRAKTFALAYFRYAY